MQCAGTSRIRPLRVDARRVVEAQHQVSTRKLTDSDAEQQLLEQLIETAKPPERTRGRQHYLLFTPFRYPPLKHGSRFGARSEPGIWYGSEQLRTAFAEVAYYRFVFMEGTRAELGLIETALTAFTVSVQTKNGIDLTARPFTRFEDALASRTSYDAAQQLGLEMRAAAVIAFRYRSARDVRGGNNIAVFSADAFGRRVPRDLQTWHCAATREQVDLRKRDYFTSESYSFVREEFLVAGKLPAPAL